MLENKKRLSAFDPHQDFKIGKILCHPEKEIRDKGIVVLKRWLSQHKNPTELDYLKIWRALYYCFWMSDKPEIQYELAQTIAKLIHSPPDKDATFLFIQQFFVYLNREWASIDKWRIDKYLWLLRFVYRQMLEFILEDDFNEKTVDTINSILTSLPMNPDASLISSGIQMQIIHQAFSEIKEVFGENFWEKVDIPNLFSIYYPFLVLLSSSDSKSVIDKIGDDLIDPLIEEWVNLKREVETGKSSKIQQKRSSLVKLEKLLVDLDEFIFAISKSEDTRERNRAPIFLIHENIQLNFKNLGTITKRRNFSGLIAEEKLEEDSRVEQDITPKSKVKKMDLKIRRLTMKKVLH